MPTMLATVASPPRAQAGQPLGRDLTSTALLACGIVASLTYVATDIYAASRYPGYSFADQAVSELFAIGAPTSHIVVRCFTLSSGLVAACALGVWRTSHQSRAQRVCAWMMLANAANSLVLWNVFPMHMRGEPQTFTDAMHGLLAIDPFVLLSVVCAIAAFKGWLRWYSVVSVLVLLIPAVLSFSNISAFVANQPTPNMGLTERVSQYGYQLWQAVLAGVLLHRSPGREAQARYATPEPQFHPSPSTPK